ncbi:MAG: D-aminoacyl-tRNA deacylase [Parachlamydiales bacterium]|jgi:D-tyrosyl-tRNA(Tyr) deacylase
MRLLIQRVSSASVTVEGERVSAIQKGLLVLLGIHRDDTAAPIPWLINKLLNLRIFNDMEDKMNLSIQDVKGEILLISQFTLYADCSRGRRPDFFHAAGGSQALTLYEFFIQELKKAHFPSAFGIFGADMKVELNNDGPVTVLVEKGPDYSGTIS